jgi:predicted metal-dependent phosphoesterase TrpH
MEIDLHTHTTASDGSFTPSQLVHHAKEKGLKVLAVTDHDTIDGNEEALSAGKREGLEVVPGIEISVDYSPGSMHMLGYFIDTGNRQLKEKLALLQDSRSDRNPKIIAKLNELGLAVSYDEVVQASGGGQVGRPHIAQVLLKKGYTTTIQEAFDKYLGKGAPAYFDKFRLIAEDAIAMITDAGGVPVLAHPFTLKCKNQGKLEDLIRHLATKGLKGIEVYYTEHSEQQTKRYRLLAERNNLLITGGSDFHGANMAGVELGRGRGKLHIPYSLFEKLKTCWEEGKNKVC